MKEEKESRNKRRKASEEQNENRQKNQEKKEDQQKKEKLKEVVQNAKPQKVEETETVKRGGEVQEKQDEGVQKNNQQENEEQREDQQKKQEKKLKKVVQERNRKNYKGKNMWTDKKRKMRRMMGTREARGRGVEEEQKNQEKNDQQKK